MNYNRYKYIYPPYPEISVLSTKLGDFNNGVYLGQPKLNGTCMEIYTNGQIVLVMDQRKNALDHKINITELKQLHKGRGWMLICGEYMNKNKTDENNKIWNHKFVIFDILVYNGTHLINKTFNARCKLLEKLYPNNLSKPQLHQISKNCFRVNSFKTNFLEVYNNINKYDIFDGLILKKVNSGLEDGDIQFNNMKNQLKCRK